MPAPHVGRPRCAAHHSWFATFSILLASGAQPARAWTNTRVESASAHVEVLPTGALSVALTVQLRVRGGWISQLEVEGLEGAAELDPTKPVALVGEDGRKYLPTARLDNERLVVGFPHRRAAPWRGRYELFALYQTDNDLRKPERAGQPARIRYSLPAWEVGLEDVHIWVTAPEGSRITTRSRAHVSHEQWSAGRLALHHLQRPQLPRTVDWPIEIAVPPAQLPAAALPPAPATPSQQPVGASPGPPGARAGWGMIAILTLLCLLKQSLGPPAGMARRLLIPLASRWRVPATIMGSLGAALLHADHPIAAQLVLFLPVALSVPTGTLAKPAGGPDSRVTLSPRHVRVAQERALAGRFAGEAWLDITTLPGALLLACLWALGLAWQAARPDPLLDLLGPHLALLASVLFVTGTRFNRPPDADQRLLLLARAAATMGSAGLPTRLTTPAGPLATGPRHARVEVVFDNPPAGLVSLVCLTATRREGARLERLWRAEILPDSPAAAAIRKALPDARALGPLGAPRTCPGPPSPTTLVAKSRDLASEAAGLVQAMTEAAPGEPTARPAAA